MKTKNRVIYFINVDDLQNVADQELERELTDKEIEFIEKRLGDYIDWYGAKFSALTDLKN
ncbi:hypothetical protein MYX76_00250 [Desulfobacterota bacterium AH_259_B03_O07]|nr:hypothetical protein [Desulfobacterota bacterium AH_259_B03_O07]